MWPVGLSCNKNKSAFINANKTKYKEIRTLMLSQNEGESNMDCSMKTDNHLYKPPTRGILNYWHKCIIENYNSM